MVYVEKEGTYYIRRSVGCHGKCERRVVIRKPIRYLELKTVNGSVVKYCGTERFIE